MLESRVLKHSNEFNIPYGGDYGYEAMYFGVNLILMHEYRLSFDINVLSEGDDGAYIEVLILRRKDFQTWKDNQTVPNVYQKRNRRINDVFTPAESDSYVLVLNNRYSNVTKRVTVALTHSWKQETGRPHQ